MTARLETERLILRKPIEADFEAEAEFMASERSQFVGGPVSRLQAWRSFATMLGHWEMRGYGFFAIEAKDGGAYLGRAGPWFPEGWPEPEIGWSLTGAAEGRGIAHEAAQAARRYVYETLAWPTAISLINPKNARSLALAKKLGARLERDITHELCGPVGIWRHPSPADCKASEAA